MELKWKKDLTEEALCQIDEKQYNMEFRADDILTIMKLGIAFSGKKVIIKADYKTF